MDFVPFFTSHITLDFHDFDGASEGNKVDRLFENAKLHKKCIHLHHSSSFHFKQIQKCRKARLNWKQ